MAKTKQSPATPEVDETGVDNNAEAAHPASATNDLSALDKDELLKLVSELSAENKALAETKGDPNPVITLAGGAYLVKGGIRFKGRKYTAEEVAGNKALCEQLVKIKSPILQKKA